MRNLPLIRILSTAILLASQLSNTVVFAAETVSGNWFSVVSILKHDKALDRAHDVELAGNLAFVPGKGGSLAIIDVANPGAPKILWFQHDPLELEDSETVLPLGNRLLLGSRDFFSMDITHPEKPVFLKKVSERQDGRIDKINGMVKMGNTVFAANKSGWINAFDVSDPANPFLAGALNVSQKFGLLDPHDIDASGNSVVIVCPRTFGRYPTGQIAIFKVRDEKSGNILPEKEWLLTGMAEGAELIGANRVQVSGSYAYTSGSWSPEARKDKTGDTTSKVCVVDISNPHFPRVVSHLPFSDDRGPNGLTISGNIAFPAGGETVEAVDITNPLKPVKLGSQLLPASNINPDPKRRTDNAHDLVHRNGYLYVSCQSDNSFMILKITDERIRKLADGH